MNEKVVIDQSVAPELIKPRKREIKIAPANELLNKPYLNEHEVSAITGLSVQTLRNNRHMRRGITYYKISKRLVRYKTEDIITFMERQRISFEEVIE